MNRILDISLRLLGAAAIAAPVASCSESTVDPEAWPQPQSSPIPIEYRTSLQTRAATLYQSASDIKEFHVWSIAEGGEKGGVHYIPGDTIVENNGKYVQADGHVRYWPQPDTKLGFFAVSGLEKCEYDSIEWSTDRNGKDVCVTLKNYLVERNKEVKHESSHEGSSGEMNVASDADDGDEYETIVKDEEFDIVVAMTGAVESPQKNASGASAVNLSFQHALSCIEFRARNIDPALDVEITGIGLKHIQNVGDLRAYLIGEKAGKFEWDLSILNPLDTADDRKKPTFKIPFDGKVELHGKTEAEAPTINIPLKATADENPSKYALMMIPQPLNEFYPKKDGNKPYRPHGSSLMLRANIWNVADDDGEHDDNDKKVWGINEKAVGEGEWMLLPCGDTWEPGKKYIYTVTFGGEGTYGGYEEDEIKNDKDRVFDPIGFKVEIEPWIAGGDIVQNIY